ncbi:unnamed protein product [Dovyalis caffra]|uniref:Uncharacterized protein n=1 Tax=Dovyalis caffra TaxID=77055 RepID=A0AAV1RV39_9ROSI|nr:unnamed protein product [Dovyalis caffra]
MKGFDKVENVGDDCGRVGYITYGQCGCENRDGNGGGGGLGRYLCQEEKDLALDEDRETKMEIIVLVGDGDRGLRVVTTMSTVANDYEMGF